MSVVDIVAAFFVLVGSKVLLGFWVCYLLLPGDADCASCNARTLPLQAERGRRRLYGWLRLQRRWCMECGRESLGKRLVAGPAGTPRQAWVTTTRSSQ